MSGKVRRLRQPRWNRVDLVHMGANYDPASGEGSHVMLFKAAPPAPKPPVVGESGPELVVPRAQGGIINGPGTYSLGHTGTVNVTAAGWTSADTKKLADEMARSIRPKADAAPDVAGGATIAGKASAESAPSPGDKPVGDTPSAAPAASTSTVTPSTSTVQVAAAAPIVTPSTGVPSTVTPSTETQPDIAKQFADMRAELAVEKARADQVEKALREMREVEADRVFTDHASQYDTVAPVDDVKVVLKAAAAAGPEALAKFDEVMKAAAARVGAVDKWQAQSGSNVGLFGEVGTAKQANPNGALGQIDAAAAEIQKANPELSVEQARARALKANKHLYGEYISDHPGVGRAAR